ncbi:MAG: response regulator [Sphaerochaetaceae bacterium]|nr:response regulator [Sphaerochaetaceae bacterium]
MRILIVDDEIMISQWLEFTIASLADDKVFIDSASNGEEALVLIKDHDYDLIFVDVMMPKLNGIGLLRELNLLGCEAMLIVLSSHDEFKFAKEAIKYHVHEYVLKNECSKEKISEILTECRQRLLQRRSDNELSEEQMRRIISDNISSQIRDCIAAIYPEIQEGRYSVMVISDQIQDFPKVLTVRGVNCNVVQRIGRLENCSWYIVSMFVDVETVSYNQARQKYAEFLSDELKTQVVLSKFCDRPSDVISGCRSAWIGYQNLFYEKVRYHVGPVRYQNFDSEAVDSLCDQTLAEIRLYKDDTIVQSIRKLNTYFREYRPTDTDAVKSIYLAILSTFVIYNNKKSRNVTGKLESIRTSISEFSQFDSLAKWALAIIENNADLVSRSRFSPSVESALDYIEEHYQSINSVNEIADHVNLSPDYFSRYFKKEVGVTLNTYLINYRLDKASIILLSSNLSVQEVAKKVGIDNGSYFSKCFKKKFHTQPIQFRIQTKN